MKHWWWLENKLAANIVKNFKILKLTLTVSGEQVQVLNLSEYLTQTLKTLLININLYLTTLSMCKNLIFYGRKGKTWSGLETSRRIKLFSWRRMKKIRSVLTSNTSNSAKLKSDAPINNPNKPPAFASISIKLWDSERFCGMNCSSVKDITTRLKVELKIEKNNSLKIF